MYMCSLHEKKMQTENILLPHRLLAHHFVSVLSLLISSHASHNYPKDRKLSLRSDDVEVCIVWMKLSWCFVSFLESLDGVLAVYKSDHHVSYTSCLARIYYYYISLM